MLPHGVTWLPHTKKPPDELCDSGSTTRLFPPTTHGVPLTLSAPQSADNCSSTAPTTMLTEEIKEAGQGEETEAYRDWPRGGVGRAWGGGTFSFTLG